MQTLIHSAFLQALGYAIANSLWQVALMWLIVTTFNSLFKFSASVKYRVAITAQVASFSWFLFTLFFYYRASSIAMAEAAAIQKQSPDLLIAPAPELYDSTLLSFIVRTEQLLPYLSFAYLCLLSFLLVKWIRSYRYTTLVQTHGLHKIDVDWKLFVKRIASQLGIKTEVKIYLSELVKSPMTIGFLKPVILIPIASINHLSVEQLEAIILHEMAHIRRLDYLINLFVSIIEICLFFNPFTQLLSKVIKNERENSCDDWVLQYQYQPAMYAEALLRLAYLQATPSLAMHAVSNKQLLLTRVKRMLDQNQNKFNYRQQLLALLLMTGILSSLAWFQPKKQQNISKNISASTVVEPLVAKVENPLFNPAFFLSKPLKEEAHKAIAEQKRNYEQAKIMLRELNIPSIAPVSPEKLHAANLAIINSNLAKASNKLWLQMKELNMSKYEELLPLTSSFNTKVMQLDSFTAVFNKDLFRTAPVVVNYDQLKNEMLRAKVEMLKLEKQGLMKFNEANFNKEFNAVLSKIPTENAPSYEGLIQHWVETNALTESRVKIENLRTTIAQTDNRTAARAQYRRDSVAAYTAPNIYYSYATTDEKETAGPNETKERSKAPTAFRPGSGYTVTNGSNLFRRKAEDDIVLVGPPTESSVITVNGRQITTKGLTTGVAGGGSLKAVSNVTGTKKNAPVADKIKERKILRIASF
jgi:beta-lactamase regulating signal transducer with metallopeptidase domain